MQYLLKVNGLPVKWIYMLHIFILSDSLSGYCVRYSLTHFKCVYFQAVSFKADNNRLRLEMDEMKHSVTDRNNDNDEILIELEEKIEDLKRKYERDITRLQSDHQQEVSYTVNV